MNYSKSFDEVLADLLTAHYNKSGNAAGTFLTVVYSAISVIAWGCYYFANYAAQQIHPDTSDSTNLEKHAKTYGLNRIENEKDAELLQRIEDHINYPVAGGNQYDWPRWAKEVSYTHNPGDPTEWIETVNDAIIHENQRGGGTINLVITSDRTDTGFEEVPTSSLIDAVEAYVETLRPLGVWDYLVLPAAHRSVVVNLNITAVDFESVSDEIEDQLIAYMKALHPGEQLTLSAIHAIAFDAGASDCDIITPTQNVVPTNGPNSYQRIWPDTITINEV